MKKTVSEIQDSTLNGFNRALNSKCSEPTLLQTLVSNKRKSITKKTENVYGGGIQTSLTREKMEEISKKNIETIALLDDKSQPKKKYISGQAKPKTVSESAYSKTQKGLKEANIPVGETVTINGKTYRKIK